MLDTITLATDLYTTLADGNDTIIESNTFAKILLKEVAQGMNLEPRLDLNIRSNPNSVADKDKTVIGISPMVKLIMGKSDLSIRYLLQTWGGTFVQKAGSEADSITHKISLQYYINF